jgi:hypothetical protein
VNRNTFMPAATTINQSTNQSINQSKRKTSNVQNLIHLGHEHQAPDHEATQPQPHRKTPFKLSM